MSGNVQGEIDSPVALRLNNKQKEKDSIPNKSKGTRRSGRGSPGRRVIHVEPRAARDLRSRGRLDGDSLLKTAVGIKETKNEKKNNNNNNNNQGIREKGISDAFIRQQDPDLLLLLHQ